MALGGKRRVASFIFIAALLALSPAPAIAHADDDQPAQAPVTQSADRDASEMEMSGAEISWPATVPSDGMGMHHERPTTFEGRVLAWLGAWHPAAIHFPIALLLTVAFLELAAAVRRKPIYNASNKLLLAVGAIGAVIAAPLGWANAGLPTAEDEWFLTAHRWIGTAVPFALALLWRLKAPAERAASRPTPPYYEVLLLASVVIVLIQAYLGAEITHGANHMAF